jgi:hypothetical protein
MISNRPANQNEANDYFEQHLRGFRPIAPRSLAIPPKRAPWASLAVAAGALLATVISFVASRVQDAPVRHALTQPVTTGRLNAALRDKDEALNLLLDDASPNILTHGQRGTVLYELGRE